MERLESYPHIELWEEAAWTDRRSGIDALAAWVSRRGKAAREAVLYPPIDPETAMASPYYRRKTNSVELPEFAEGLRKQGLAFESHEMGFNTWLSLVSAKEMARGGHACALLMVECLEDSMDPNWAMRSIETRPEYQLLALRGDIVVVFNVRSDPDMRAGYASVISEALNLYPVSPDRVFLDVSVADVPLADIDGFLYRDNDGAAEKDPDAFIQDWQDGIRALNISRQYINRGSMRWEGLLKSPFNVGKYDFEALKYSPVGKRIAEGMAIEHRFNFCTDRGWYAFWADMGLDYAEHMTKGERWLSLCPSARQDEKLPVLALMAEVNASNDRLPVTQLASYFEYCQLAAKGEFILLVFALESPEDNDLWLDIFEDAEEILPIDRTRLYMLGQSHNGHFTREFAHRHSDILAAAAVLSNGPGLSRPEHSFEAVKVDDDWIEAQGKVDVPMIIIAGMNEGFPTTDEVLLDEWQRRLRAWNCPVPDMDVLRSRVANGNRFERHLKIAGDASETVTVDGIECCVIHVKNRAGKEHLCVAAMDNTPHYPAPTASDFAWDFLKRFSRNLKTGESAEFFD